VAAKAVPISTHDPEIKHLGKIAGWLALPGLGLVFALITDGAEAVASTRTLVTELGFASLFAAVVVWALLLFEVVVAWFFFRKHRWGPYLYISFLVVRLALMGLYLAVHLASPEPSTSDAPKELARALVGACVWIPYFLVSKRVKLTFVH
jgi:hypothetical protein